MRLSAISLKRWQALEPPNQAVVLKLEVSEQQVEYAGTIERAIASCEEDKENDVAGLVIKDGDAIVGFLVLKRRSKAPEWAGPQAAVVSAMRIDKGHQGKGVGSQTLQAVAWWVAANWPESSTLTLSVDEENVLGLRAYTRAGFIDHGVRVQGRIGWVRYMSRPVVSAS